MSLRLLRKVSIWQQGINMRIPRLYVDQPLQVDRQIELPQDKTHYISNVLRMHVGGAVKLFNDSDEEFDATLIELKKRAAVINVTGSVTSVRESPLKIMLGLGVSRGQHMDFAIQKAVELGVYEIVPVLTEFSNIKIQDSRKENKLSHWRNIIISATEQCGRTRLTKLREPVNYNEYLGREGISTRLIFHPGNSQILENVKLADNSLTLLIGPEGGFSDKEINLAGQKNYVVAGLGPRILRAETAVVTALSVCQHKWGDLN